MTTMVERMARAIDPRAWEVMDSYLEATKRKYAGQKAGYDPAAFKDTRSLAVARIVLGAMREPTHTVIRAMSESQARDDEGPFPLMLDLLDFSGENKTHTVLRAAWTAAIDAALFEDACRD